MKAWQKLVSVLCSAAALLGPAAAAQPVQAAAGMPAPVVNWVRIGGSVTGELYADRDSLRPYTKDGSLYVSLMVQEKFTSREFLEIMRQNPGLEDLASSLTLYMFQIKERRYFIASQFYLDSKEEVCLDLGSEQFLRPVGSDQAVKLAFEYALTEARRDSIKVQEQD